MRTTVLSFLAIFLLLGPPEVRANETPPGEPEPKGDVPIVSDPAVPVPGELRLTKVQVEERNPTSDRTADRWPERGSFLWVVGAIVVAGVILAVLL
ncbi:MAG: hypothetical protein GEU90_10245 [Gemmatimonas sp.]|nr:hypothetical protein [Gemmatimonas sp.]